MVITSMVAPTCRLECSICDPCKVIHHEAVTHCIPHTALLHDECSNLLSCLHGVVVLLFSHQLAYSSPWSQDRLHISVKIRPRKACRYPNLRSFGWVSYDKVGGLYSGKLGIRSEARASDLRSYPGLWWKRIKLHLYEGTKVSTLRGPAQLADLQGALCVPHR